MFCLENKQILWLSNSIYPKKIKKNIERFIYEGILNEAYKSQKLENKKANDNRLIK